MIRPSSLPRVMQCPASPKLCAGRPRTGDETAANEGTEAHEYGRRVLSENMALSEIPDLEMRRAVEVYASICRSYQNLALTFGIEQSISAEIHGHTQKGTPDFWAVSPGDGLTVVDLKYGFRPVEADSWQLIDYAVMLWGSQWQYKWTPHKVNLVVVQPRGMHPEGQVRRYTFDGELLRNYYNQIGNALGLACIENPEAIAGGQCYRCPATIECNANSLAVLNAMDVAVLGQCFPVGPDGMGNELDYLYKAQGLIKNRLAAMEESAFASITSGKFIPGYQVSTGLTALKWSIPDPVQAARDIGVEIAKPEEAITPTQAQARNLLTEQQINWMARRETTAPKLKKFDCRLAEKLIKGN